MARKLPAPWVVERIPGGYVVKDATGQSLAYVYARDTKADADIAKVLTMDEACRVAINIAKLPALLGAGGNCYGEGDCHCLD
jgi:hypothetical protein